ncbi:hypothetical protein KKG44_00880 [Patescibacteria group bacterium]|nr:hypothetical protein [Patescibacteria group bacterium]MBU2459653.1 hypothetical protein [Patescibacteria group bacterium]
MPTPKKIPTLLGILLVIILVALISVMFENIVRQNAKASLSVEPTSVAVTNVTDTMFTVAWITESPATGVLTVTGASEKKKTVFDDRDIGYHSSMYTGKLGKYITHSITFRYANPGMNYEVVILSNGKPYTSQGVPYQIRTPETLASPGNSLEPAFGTVVTSEGQYAQGALVYLTLENSQMLSTLVQSSGTWLIPLNLARIKDLSVYVTPEERITETIFVRYEGEQTTALSDTLNDAPVPTMVIGKTYDFRKTQAGTGTNDLASSVSHASSVLGQTTQRQNGAFDIIRPAQGASLATYTPLIAGSGIPGKTVTLTIGITSPIGGTAIVGSDGIWRYTPPKPLAPGKQSVTATTTDEKGKPVAFTHTFEILKSGTQVLGEATPSATLEPTPTSEPASPSATSTPVDLAGEPVPTSGTTLPTLILFLLGAGLLTGGFVVKIL